MRIDYNVSGLTKEVLINLYLSMLKPRMIEEKMLLLLRQGKISKWFSGIGQEAISSAVINALDKDSNRKIANSTQLAKTLRSAPGAAWPGNH